MRGVESLCFSMVTVTGRHEGMKPRVFLDHNDIIYILPVVSLLSCFSVAIGGTVHASIQMRMLDSYMYRERHLRLIEVNKDRLFATLIATADTAYP